MKRTMKILVAMCIFAVSGMGNVALAEETKAPEAMHEEAMKKMMELASPGEMHKILDQLVGKWDYTVRFQMSPDAPVQESKGTNENKWILGGRFLQQDVQGTMNMGGGDEPFNGFGLSGYDNIKKEFNGIWIDSMGTGMMISKGTYDEATKTIKDTGTFSCPMKGAEVSFRSELKFIDADTYNFAMYSADDSGKEFKTMDIEYKRAK